MATTPAVKQVLDGTYEYPTNCDQATKALLKECSRIREKVPENLVSTSIKQGQWQAGNVVEAMLTEILEMNYFFAHGIWQLKELQRKYN